MCGIFGFAKTSGHQTENQLETLKDVLTELADESSIRGTDSTGMSIIQPNSRQTYKTLLDSSTLVTTGDWDELLDSINVDTTIAIGHVRLATHGVIKTRNAHPFTVGDVVGAHNGIIHNYNKVAKSLGKSVEVDSQVIFASLNRNKMKNAFEDIDGDFAITWIKDSNRKIHLARESGRPMYIAYWKKARILLWASTKEILDVSMTKAGLKLPTSKVVEDYIHTYDTDNFSSKPNVEKESFHTISQWNKITNYYGGYGWSSRSTDYVTCDMNPSPASKSLMTSRQELMCNYCYEWVDNEEVITIANENICIDCEYSIDFPTYTKTDKENNDDKVPF
jgi:glucosamine 6-phosphate synthetase-like amidotransferase/phosphosugar isomerase protein